jgi:hypothetical protein
MAIYIYHGALMNRLRIAGIAYHIAVWVTPFFVLHVLLGWL